MIRDIARKEFICLIRDGRFKWAIVIMLLLLMTSFLTGYQRYQSLHSIQEASQARDNEQWLRQDKKNQHTAAHFGNSAHQRSADRRVGKEWVSMCSSRCATYH